MLSSNSTIWFSLLIDLIQFFSWRVNKVALLDNKQGWFDLGWNIIFRCSHQSPVVQIFRVVFCICIIIRDGNLILEVVVLQLDLHLACVASGATVVFWGRFLENHAILDRQREKGYTALKITHVAFWHHAWGNHCLSDWLSSQLLYSCISWAIKLEKFAWTFWIAMRVARGIARWMVLIIKAALFIR